MPITIIDPKTALVVIDLQKGILSMPTVHDAHAVVAKALKNRCGISRKKVNRCAGKRYGRRSGPPGRRGVTQIVICGIATSLGVKSTARAASEHGYNLTFVSDAMTDRVASRTKTASR